MLRARGPMKLLLLLLALASTVYLARRPLLTGLGAFLVVEDPPRPADAIVVLSGSIPDRILAAVDLYHGQLAPRIVITREGPRPGIEALRAKGGRLLDNYEENLRIAQELGVPAAALAVMPTVTASTIAEAAALIAFLDAEGIRSILLVTSKGHARRSAMIFRQLGGERLAIAMCPSPYDPFAPDAWWQRRGQVRRVVIEYLKFLNYLLVDRWRTWLPEHGERQ